LLDKLEEATLAEVQQRHTEMNAREQKRTARVIAVVRCDFSAEVYATRSLVDFKEH